MITFDCFHKYSVLERTSGLFAAFLSLCLSHAAKATKQQPAAPGIMFTGDFLIQIAIAIGFPEAQRLGQTAKWLLAPVRQAAARAFVAEVVADFQQRRLLEQLDYRHRARPVTPGSVPLPQRQRNDLQGLSGGFNDLGGHRPARPRGEGDLLRMLLSLLLHDMRARGCMRNMTHLPLQAREVDVLHSKNWRKFAGWHTMTFNEQTNHLRDFLLQKFSLDPDMRCMLPGIGARRLPRNNARWIGFELTDVEMERLLKDVMSQYAQAVEQASHQPTPAQ